MIPYQLRSIRSSPPVPGYIWMTHKKPSSDIWDLALRSPQLWNDLAQTLNHPEELLGWKNTGSLLVRRTSKECVALKQKVHELSDAGLRAEFLSSADLFRKEPALLVDDHTGAAFLPDDTQLDAHRAVAYIEKGNRELQYKEDMQSSIMNQLQV